MESSTEKRFYDALGVVPEVPAELFGRIERAARRPSAFRRAGLAACLALALIIPAAVITNIGAPKFAGADDYDFVDELFYAFDYVNGDFDDDDYLFIDNQFTLLSEGENSIED